jgi:hypothetical protein
MKTEFVDDAVPEEIRITRAIDSIGIDSTFRFEAAYFDNGGNRDNSRNIWWTSSDTSVAEIDSASGIAVGKSIGNTSISAHVLDNSNNSLMVSEMLFVGQQGMVSRTEKQGTIFTTSSYALRGTYTFIQEDDEFTIEVNSDYFATDALPGLYIYLSNNLNSLNGSYEIGPVTVFEGAHSYNLGSEININDYQYILYYCKPFNVEVGEGRPNN